MVAANTVEMLAGRWKDRFPEAVSSYYPPFVHHMLHVLLDTCASGAQLCCPGTFTLVFPRKEACVEASRTMLVPDAMSRGAVPLACQGTYWGGMAMCQVR